jgi:hypothetical protein
MRKHSVTRTDVYGSVDRPHKRGGKLTVLPAAMATLVKRGLFEPADDGSFILTAKGRRLAEAGKIPDDG